MSRIFLSHSSKDNFEAIAVRDWLVSEGWNDIFLDLDPERGVAAGERWERALHEAASRCEAVIFLVSASWLASGWCLKEYTLARTLNKKLFAALIDPGKTVADLPPEFTGTWQVVDFTGGQDARILRTSRPGSHEEKHVAFSNHGLRRLKRGIEKAGLDPKFFAWPPAGEPNRAPYRGLKPLESSDAGVFFGRDAPIVEATDRLRGLRDAAVPRLLVILGASGAGKSSFLRAGLLPRLARDDGTFLPLPLIRPERAALFGESGLLHALEAAVSVKTRAEIRAAIHAGVTGVRPLLTDIADAAFRRTLPDADGARPPTIVVTIDQAEELFRAEGADEGLGLLTLIRDLTAEDAPAVIAIFAIRSDSYDALEHAKPLEGLPQTTLPLLPMPRGAYKDVIERPARRFEESGGKLTVEPQLTLRLLEDVERGSGSDSLPLLAFTLDQLFLEYQAAGALRLSDYEAFGGIKGAITAAIERVFLRADADSRIPRERSVREALLRRGLIPWLAGIDPDTRSPRRNIALRAEIPAEAAPLIDLLVEERLLTTDVKKQMDDVTGVDAQIATIEPAHEALLRQWGLLQGWLDEDFGLLTVLEGVKRAARDWDANARGEAWLAHQGQRLAEAQNLDARPDIAAKLDVLDRAYLARCSAREEHELTEAEQRRLQREADRAEREGLRTRLLRGAIAAAVLGLVLAVLAGWQAWVARGQRAIAVEQRNTALLTQSKYLTQLSEQQTEAGDAGVGLLLALEALPDADSADEIERTKAVWPPARFALDGALRAYRERLILRGHEGGVNGVAISPDGQRLASVANNEVRIWDARSGEALAVLKGHADFVIAVAFTPDGSRVVTASQDKTARVWDVKSGAQVLVLNGHTGDISGIAVTGDGERIVTGSYDGSARVWNANTGAQMLSLLGHKERIYGVAVSPDGSRIATSSSDGTARIWDAKTGAELAVLPVSLGSIVMSVAFAPDGLRIVTGAIDGLAKVWDAKSGSLLAVLRGHTGGVSSVAFTPDGSRIVTGSYDNDKTVRLWDAKTGTVLTVLAGHTDRINSVAVAPNGTRIVSASRDRTVRVWDMDVGSEVRILRGHSQRVVAVAAAPNGAFVVTGSEDLSVRAWDPTTGALLAVLDGHTREVNALAVSPDGSYVVSASGDRTVRVWDAKNWSLLTVLNLKSHTSGIFCVAITPDGSRVVTGSADNTARVWDVKSGAELLVLKGHTGEIHGVAVTPDGSRIVTGSADNTVRVWDAKTGAELLRASAFNLVWSVAVTPDGSRILAATANDDVLILDARTGRQLSRLETGGGQTHGVAVTPDGSRFITGSEDRTLRVWDAQDGTLLAQLKGPKGMLWGVAVLPDGAHVIAGSDDPVVRIWEILPSGQALVRRAKQALRRCLTPEQRTKLSLAGPPAGWCGRLDKWPYDPVGALIEGKLNLEAELDGAADMLFGAALAAHPELSAKINNAWIDAYIARGSQLLQDSEDGKAKAQFDFAMARDPAAAERIDKIWVEAHIARGKQRLIEGKDDEADAQFASAMTRDPKSAETIDKLWAAAFYSRGLKMFQEGKEREAKEQFDRAIAHLPALAKEIETVWATAYVARGAQLFGEGKDEEAAAQFELAIKSSPAITADLQRNWANALVTRGLEEFKKGEDEQSERSFAQALQHDPAAVGQINLGKANIYFDRAWNLLQQSDDDDTPRRQDDALAVIDKALAVIPDLADSGELKARLIFTRGRAYFGKGQYNDAIREFAAADQLGNADAKGWLRDAYDHQAEDYWKQKLYEQALLAAAQLYLNATADAPNAIRPPRTLVWGIGLLYRRDRPPPVGTEITECDQLAGDKVDPMSVSDGTPLGAVEPGAAIPACRRAIADHPDEARLHFALARAHTRAADMARAAKDLTKAGESDASALAELEIAMERGYPWAFVYAIRHHGEGLAVEKDDQKADLVGLQALTRELACCWVLVARSLLAKDAAPDAAATRDVVRAYTRWAAELGSADARALYAELTGSNAATANLGSPQAMFTDPPSWLKPKL